MQACSYGQDLLSAQQQGKIGQHLWNLEKAGDTACLSIIGVRDDDGLRTRDLLMILQVGLTDLAMPITPMRILESM